MFRGPGEQRASLKGGWGVITLFIFVMGGTYGGIGSPTEAAGIGAFGAFIFGGKSGKLLL